LDPPTPDSHYGLSKHEAETALRAVARDTNLEWVIIRSPLVYGPGVRANFLALARLVARGIPLPFGAVNNKRSLVSLSNLVDFIVTCAEHPSAAGEVFFVSDGEDLSTAELIRGLARATGRRARLIPVPVVLLKSAAMMSGQRGAAQRLLGSLQVDISKARQRLGWAPPIGIEEGLKRVVAACAAPAKPQP
jgi:nucleoside-diphosphate-sugar epimerase